MTLSPGRGRGDGASGSCRILLNEGGKDGFEPGSNDSVPARRSADDGAVSERRSLCIWSFTELPVGVPVDVSE